LYFIMPSTIWRRLPRQTAARPLSLALANAGKRNDAKIAMIAITTSSSIKVNAAEG
jgi:hypothetical protein